MFRIRNARVIHAYAHETMDLNFSTPSRRKIKLILYSDRAKISLQKYNLSLILGREAFKKFKCKVCARKRESRVRSQLEITTLFRINF